MKICIVSPIKFWDTIMEKYNEFSNKGNIVFIPVKNGEDEELLFNLHKQKIDMCDKVFVVNKNGYMGRGTYEEIGYAVVHGKTIEFLEPINTELTALSSDETKCNNKNVNNKTATSGCLNSAMLLR